MNLTWRFGTATLVRPANALSLLWNPDLPVEIIVDGNISHHDLVLIVIVVAIIVVTANSMGLK